MQRLTKPLLLLFQSLLLFVFTEAQVSRISGIVTGPDNNPLIGATVQIKGTSSVTTTASNGSFSIPVTGNTQTLVFSYVGMQTTELPIAGRTTFDVQLSSVPNALNEVVVVGYGSEKKINLTGSVASVSSEELLKRPAPNAANLLQGKVSGLNIIQSTGQPGRDNPSISIRGLGSFGASSNPLVLIDGVIGDLTVLSPNDIASVSVLKDAASAAIYGARAANGVILVTTKRGKTGFNVDYSYNISSQQATRLPDLIYNSVEYMQMYNQARIHSNMTALFTDAQINAYKNAAAGSAEFPNYNWEKNYFKKATAQTHYISVNGGNEKTTYNFSMNLLDQDGIIKSHSYNRWNGLLNVDSKLSNMFKIGANISFLKQSIQEPWLTNDDMVLLIYSAGPTYAPYLPDGSGRYSSTEYRGTGHNRSPEVVLENGGRHYDSYQARAQVYGEANLMKGLTWMVKGAFNYTNNFTKMHQYAVNTYVFQKAPGDADYQYLDNGSPTALGVTDNDDRQVLLNTYSTLNYETSLKGGHSLRAMVGYNQESFVDQTLGGNRSGFPSDDLMQINAGSTNGQSVNGTSYEWALRSYFGRINYNYLEKYLLEVNGRYDGTSRISPENRWGFFPSVSAGWRISKENFMKNLSSLNVKLRGSYGKLGNQEIGNYPYQSVYNIVSYPFNGTVVQGVSQGRLTDRSLQWETTTITDIGLDVDIKNGLFSATIDWYNKQTKGILNQPQVPASVGLSAPTVNYGSLDNKGWDINIGHSNKIGDFRYAVNGILSINKNEVTQLRAPAYGVGDVNGNPIYTNQLGLPYRSYYLLDWIGIFQSQDEITKSPTQPNNPKPGDLKFRDVDGNGKIDANDRVVMKGAYPDYTYSFNVNLSWKNFDLNAFFQGVQGQKHYVRDWGAEPFAQASPPTTDWRNAWTPENHSQTMPALYAWGYGPVGGSASDYFLQDASYLRLKNIQLTYRFSKSVTTRLHMKNLSVYISGDNLITWTKYPGADPERITDGRFAQFPQLKVLTAGVRVQF